MSVIDDFGNSLYVVPPGKVPAANHVILQYSRGDAKRLNRPVVGMYVCSDCGEEFNSLKNVGPCYAKTHTPGSGFGDKTKVVKSNSGLFTWLCPEDMKARQPQNYKRN